jgi:hypothetical protein
LSIDFNGPAGIVVSLNASALSKLPATPAGGFADDAWHHCVLQRDASLDSASLHARGRLQNNDAG